MKLGFWFRDGRCGTRPLLFLFCCCVGGRLCFSFGRSGLGIIAPRFVYGLSLCYLLSEVQNPVALRCTWCWGLCSTDPLPNLYPQTPDQIFIKSINGKPTIIWVRYSDLVVELKKQNTSCYRTEKQNTSCYKNPGPDTKPDILRKSATGKFKPTGKPYPKRSHYLLEPKTQRWRPSENSSTQTNSNRKWNSLIQRHPEREGPHKGEKTKS